MPPSKITADEFTRILREGMPYADDLRFEIVSLEHGLAHVRFRVEPRDVRPGGTLAGPLLFSFADLAIYAAVLSAIGPVPLAVTTDATIHFLRKPPVAPIVARARMLKVGKRLAVGDTELSSEGGDTVAHAVMTYAIPS